MRRLAVFFLSLSTCAAQTSSVDDPKALLLEARKQVMSTLTRLPRYLCTETVDREMRRPGVPLDRGSCDDLAGLQKTGRWKLSKTASDRLRLDVAVSADNEMYSWVGEERFQDRTLADLVGGGATSTGAFATYLRSIFGSNDAQFTFLRGSPSSNERLVEFGFAMPLEKSHLTVGDRQRHAVVAYDGSFLVDRQTLSLVRLTVRALRVPVELGICSDTTTLDYEVKKLNESEFLLPKKAQFDVVSWNGNELVNRTAFSACHEFHGESALKFDVPSETDHGASVRSSSIPQTVTGGLSFTIALAQSIDPRTAAAGDLLKTKLTGPLRDRQKAVLASKGSLVLGRILQVEKLYGIYGPGVQSLRIGIRLESIEVNGATLPFRAQLSSLEKRRITQISESHESRHVGTQDRLVRPEELGSFDQMINPADDGVGYLFFDDVTDEFIVRAGTQLSGTTLKP
jgi:hypothetical protein